MDIRRTRTCERCKNVVTLDKIRIVPKSNDINMVVCENCVNEMKTSVQSKITNSQSRYAAETPKKVSNSSNSKYCWASPKISALPTPDYANYKCVHCSYTFRVDRVKAGLTYGVKCPYCGRTDKLKLNK